MTNTHREVILDSIECSALKEIILDNETSVKELGPDVYGGRAGNNALTGRYSVFNWLNNLKFRKILLPKLKNFFKKLNYASPIIVQCWANTFRLGEGIMIHDHDPLVTSANIFICGDPKIGTNFVVNGKHQNVANKEGEITIFDGTTLHYVDPNPTNDVRISVAMDIYLNGELPPDLENKNRYYTITL